ncbi:YfdX family protein [Geobacter sp.]|uniref:YfdX family protein n=1 Tax=Geobacter sp. TaxID=46610 RepID=UPI00263506D5|nr:YfdX family protein [Geobacter sp.]
MNRLTVVLLTAAAMISVVGTPASGARGRGAAGLYREIPPTVESTVIQTAVLALGDIAEARKELREGRSDEALRKVDEARILARSVGTDLTTGVVREQIRIAREHAGYDPPQRVLKDLGPVYDSLNEIEVYIPVDKARRHVDRAAEFLKAGRNDDAARELGSAEMALPVFTLPMMTVVVSLERARSAIGKKEVDAADVLLRKAESTLQAGIASRRSPIGQAQASIMRARFLFVNGDYADARRALGQARAFLDAAAAQGSAVTKSEAPWLSQEVGALEKRIEKEREKSESSLRAIGEEVAALAERTAADLAYHWDETETTLRIDDVLLDARLHLAYAETFQLTTGEPLKAKRELDLAREFIGKAMKSLLADSADRAALQWADREIFYLGEHIDQTGPGIEERYDALRSRINGLLTPL